MPRFAEPASLTELAAVVGGEIDGREDVTIAGVASLEKARPGDLSFLTSGKYADALDSSKASAILLGTGCKRPPRDLRSYLVVSDPRGALIKLLDHAFPDPAPHWGVGSAHIGIGATWDGRISLADGAQLGRGVTFGRECVVGPGVQILDGVSVGDRCRIHSGAVVHPGVTIGNDVLIKSGARLGTPGFGFGVSEAGFDRIPHAAGVVLEDDVEIGANSTVDCGSVEPTEIGAGTKIDNLVHIGHNVKIGAGCVILAQVGIAGSTVVEDRAMIGGQAGLSGHLTIGAGARVAAQSGVIGNVAPGETVSGYPARKHREVLRQAVALRRITTRLEQIERLTATDEC